MSFTVSITSSFTSPSLVTQHDLPPSFFLRIKLVKPKSVILSPRRLSTSCGPAPKAASSAPTNEIVPETPPKSASEIVSRFYAAINGNDSSASDLIAQDCVYEDLIFSFPFVGRTAILDFFGKFIESTGTDMQFVIDDISTEDSSAVGVSRHLDM